ncbi:MAG TPA: tetratricopeptide repeat protein [Gaiellaceae bacterium]|nr:tetratricopeptide repeat protein [Gaiellaceae bacterium]
MAGSSSSSFAASSPAERVAHATEELRAAIREYENASDEQSQYQLVHAYAMLGQAHDAIARYRGMDDLVSLRCLAHAYVADGRWPEAAATIARAPEDAFMLEQQAEMFSRTGREEEALATWQRALDANPDSIGGHYMRAFLLDRLGRRDDAIREWEAIIAWSRARGHDEDVEWPEREIARLRA